MNNIYARSSYVNEEKIIDFNHNKLFTHGISGSIKMIQSHMKRYLKTGGICYYLFDNPTTQRKRIIEIDPSYKLNREKLPKAYYRGLDQLEFILRNFMNDHFIVREKFTEADDWCKPIVDELPESDILLVSTDLDWGRLISDKVHWLDKQSLYNKVEFFLNYKFYPSISNICFYKTFYGDKVDNILPAIKELYFKTFLNIIEDFSDLETFFLDVRRKCKPYLDSWLKRIERDKDLIRKNWSLVSFQPIDKMDLERYSTKTKFSKLKLSILYKSLGFDDDLDERVVKKEDDLGSFFNPVYTKR